MKKKDQLIRLILQEMKNASKDDPVDAMIKDMKHDENMRSFARLFRHFGKKSNDKVEVNTKENDVKK